MKHLPIAAITSKEDKDISRQITDMLEAMNYNKKAFTVTTDNEYAEAESTQSLSLEEAHIAVGRSSLSRENIGFRPGQNEEGLALTLDGYLLGAPDLSHSGEQSDCEVVSGLISERLEQSRNLSEAVKLALPRLDGAFSFIAMCGRQLVVARDVLGSEPLFWGENARYVAFASARKALWKIGLNNIASVSPGCVIAVDGEARMVSKVLSLAQPQVIDIGLNAAARRLAEALPAAFSGYNHGERMGLLFSGGVDSSLVAKVSDSLGLKLRLYGAAVEGARDAEAVERSASELGFKVYLRVISLDEIEDYLRKTLLAVEDANLMAAAIGVTVYAAMELAAGDGASPGRVERRRPRHPGHAGLAPLLGHVVDLDGPGRVQTLRRRHDQGQSRGPRTLGNV